MHVRIEKKEAYSASNEWRTAVAQKMKRNYHRLMDKHLSIYMKESFQLTTLFFRSDNIVAVIVIISTREDEKDSKKGIASNNKSFLYDDYNSLSLSSSSSSVHQ